MGSDPTPYTLRTPEHRLTSKLHEVPNNPLDSLFAKWACSHLYKENAEVPWPQLTNDNLLLHSIFYLQGVFHASGSAWKALTSEIEEDFCGAYFLPL